jgi:hypothetical protein
LSSLDMQVKYEAASLACQVVYLESDGLTTVAGICFRLGEQRPEGLEVGLCEVRDSSCREVGMSDKWTIRPRHVEPDRIQAAP